MDAPAPGHVAVLTVAERKPAIFCVTTAPPRQGQQLGDFIKTSKTKQTNSNRFRALTMDDQEFWQDVGVSIKTEAAAAKTTDKPGALSDDFPQLSGGVSPALLSALKNEGLPLAVPVPAMCPAAAPICTLSITTTADYTTSAKRDFGNLFAPSEHPVATQTSALPPPTSSPSKCVFGILFDKTSLTS